MYKVLIKSNKIYMKIGKLCCRIMCKAIFYNGWYQCYVWIWQKWHDSSGVGTAIQAHTTNAYTPKLG